MISSFLLDTIRVDKVLKCLLTCSKDINCKMVLFKENTYCSLFMIKIKEANFIQANNSIIFVKETF